MIYANCARLGKQHAWIAATRIGPWLRTYGESAGEDCAQAPGVGVALAKQRIMTDANRLMTLFEAIAKRRAVRAYRPDRVDESTVRELLKEAAKAPTAMHAEPWAFAVIQDRKLLRRYSDLAKATWSPERDG